MPATGNAVLRRLSVMTPILAVIFDVDGVLVDSPHEKAWRAALAGLCDPARLTPAFYQTYVAGKPRDDGARCALQHLGLPSGSSEVKAYAEAKQALLVAMIEARDFTVFPDALAFLQALRARGFKVAAASSSMNAGRMMQLIPLGPDRTLGEMFDANLCGQVLQHGKPDPEIYLNAAKALGIDPGHCLVVEDAAVGIVAGRAGGMRTLGLARRGDDDLLLAVPADLVVQNLSEVAVDALVEGRLERKAGKPDHAPRAGAE
jgi:HAD superfamily hydrolase (TIGR01509 family)